MHTAKTHAGSGYCTQFLRRHYFYHHFTDPNFNYGVTTPIWDRAFGMRRAPGLIPVPPKLARAVQRDPRATVALQSCVKLSRRRARDAPAASILGENPYDFVA